MQYFSANENAAFGIDFLIFLSINTAPSPIISPHRFVWTTRTGMTSAVPSPIYNSTFFSSLPVSVSLPEMSVESSSCGNQSTPPPSSAPMRCRRPTTKRPEIKMDLNMKPFGRRCKQTCFAPYSRQHQTQPEERRRQRPGEQVGKAYFQQQQMDLTPVGAISDTITSIYNTKMASLDGDVDKQNELTFKLWDILAGSQDRVDDAIKAHLICDPDSVPPFVKRDLLALEVFIDTDQCDYCHDRCMVYDDESGSSYCDTCGSGGETRLVLETPFASSRSSHTTNSQMSVGFETVHKHIYDRLSHFQALLNNVQGRGNSKLCPRMIETLRTKARALPGLSSVTYPWVMASLKTMRAGKFIPHAVRITQLVAQGFWNPPTIEPNDKNALVDGFVRVCEQYDRWIGENTDTKRKNFMSYPYIAYQLCMRQGLTDICGFFTLIKSDVRRATQNKLWAVICERERWAFNSL